MQKKNALYKHKLLTIVSLLIIILVSSCQKEDDIFPKVNITNPIGGNFSVLDTIQVEANISDNETVLSVRVRLININNQQVVTPYSYTVNSNSYHLTTRFVIDNLYLESGEYHLVVEADDGVNIGKDFVSIQLGALPRFLDDIIIVEKDNLQTHIYSILDGKRLIKTFDSKYLDFIYNPFSQQYFFLSEDGVLTAYAKDNLEKSWVIDDLKDPSRNTYLGHLYYKDNLVYVNSYSGAIKAYNTNGSVVKQANTIDSYGEISQYYFNYDKIMVFKNPYTFGYDKIEQLNETTGASIWTYDIQFTPNKLLFVDEGLCIVFGNRYNEARACSLSTLYNVVHPFGDFGNRTLGDAFKYSSYYYILSLDQEILEYNLSNGNERVLDTSQNNVKFYYEDLYDKLYFIDGNTISYLSFPATGSEEFFRNNRSIDDLIFVYNK